MTGEPGAAAEALSSAGSRRRSADREAVDALLAAFAGLMQWAMRQPPPQGMATVREIHRSQ